MTKLFAHALDRRGGARQAPRMFGRLAWSVVLAALGLGAFACSNEQNERDAGTPSGGHAGASGTGTCLTHQAACELVECAPPLELGLHEPPCTPLTFSSNPPTSGTHYDVWAAFEIYERPVPRGFLLHSLEHSGVVLSYNCDLAAEAGVDCTELVASLTELYETWPADPLCTTTRHRLLVTPDPDLDAVFAASAWGHYVKGDCFDKKVVSDFIDAHYGENYENICNAGVDPFGGSYAADCGR